MVRDHCCVGIDRENFRYGEHMVGILEDPGPSGLALLQQLQLTFVNPVARRQIGLVQQVIEIIGHPIQVVDLGRNKV
jgi:hypothetical protein